MEPLARIIVDKTANPRDRIRLISAAAVSIRFDDKGRTFRHCELVEAIQKIEKDIGEPQNVRAAARKAANDISDMAYARQRNALMQKIGAYWI